MEQTRNFTYSSKDEIVSREKMLHFLKTTPIPDDQILSNLGLFLESKNLARILLMDHLFQKIVNIHGNIMEFGTRWGQNAALFSALRGIYDPFNRHRKIVAFDTFSGFPNVDSKDGNHEMMKVGELSTGAEYQNYLEKILTVHENLNPANHLKKFELCKGDASIEVPRYLDKHPETIIALAFFDFDLYEPTKNVLTAIEPHLTKGSVIAFDELNDPNAPGETLAVMETLGLRNIRLEKYPFASRVSYCVID